MRSLSREQKSSSPPHHAPSPSRRGKGESSLRACLFLLFSALLCLPAFFPGLAFAWPQDSDWIPLYRDNAPIGDISADGATSRDIVGDSARPAAYTFNDGTFLYFRARLSADPTAGGGGDLASFGWGILFDTNMNADDYEYMFMIDGIVGPEAMYLARNTFQGILGDPSDKAELILWQDTLVNGGNFRSVPAGTVFPTANPDPDFFLDWKVPYSIFKTSLGLEDNSLLRVFIGSSNNSMTLTADLVAGSTPNAAATLGTGLSNPVTPEGTQPSTGSVMFVTALDGSGNMTQFTPGSPIYVKVTDFDQNSIATSPQTVTVTVTAASGDSETLLLTETGANTGTFTGQLSTAEQPFGSNNGILDVMPVEQVTVTYIDAVDANYQTNIFRTDSMTVVTSADVALTKTVDNATPNVGKDVTFTVTATNNGPSTASGMQITDLLPSGLTYKSDTSGGNYNPGTGVWSFGNIAKGAFRSLAITATVNTGTANTTITNAASITAAAQPDPNSGNNSATASIAVTGADLSVTNTVSNPVANTGSSVTFTITVTNNGSSPATGVVVRNQLPAGLSWTGDDGAGSYNTATHDWTIGALPVGATRILKITASVTAAAGSTVVNTANIGRSDQADPNNGNNSASATITVGGADLSLTKTVNNPNPAEGGAVTYSVTLRNGIGGATADNVTVNDILPAGLTYVSATAVKGSYNPATGNWSGITALAPGASTTLAINATVNSGTAAQTITNTASITASTQQDPSSGNNSASATITVDYTDLQVTQTVDNPSPTNNANITFTITVRNNGPRNATAVQLFDQLPAAVVYVSNLPSQGSFNNTTHLWDVGSLAVGETAALQITVRVNLGKNDPSTFFNQASLYSCTPTDANGSNNVAAAVASVNGTDLSLTKAVDNSSPMSGSQVVFTVTLTNNGPNAATNVTVRDLLPAGLAYVSSAISRAGFGSYNSGTGNWTFAGPLPATAPDNVVTLTITANVTAANGSTLINNAGITVADQADGLPGNNSASVTLTVGSADLSLTKTVGASPTEGGTVTYTVTLTNNGGSPATGVRVTDLLPAGLTFASAAPSQGTYDNGTGIWDVGTIAYTASPKTTASLTINATADSGTAGTTITNRASLTASTTNDPNSSNNSASVSFQVQSADIYVGKVADNSTPYEGDPVVFTITVGNHGPHTATNVVISDLLPAGLSFLLANTTQGSYDSGSGDWNVGTLAKGATATLSVTTSPAAGTAGTNLVNTVSRKSATQSDPVTTNNTASITVTPRLLLIDLQLTQSLDTATPQEGANVILTLTLANSHATRSATGIQVTDLLPAGLTFVSATPSQGSYDSSSGIWTVGSLPSGGTATLVITATTDCGTGGTIHTNVASITAQNQPDPDTSNNAASKSVTLGFAPPGIMVLKSATPFPKVNPADEITYTVTVKNDGCGRASVIKLDDLLSPFVGLKIDTYGANRPFALDDYGSPPSGLSIYGGACSPAYWKVNGSDWVSGLTPGGGGVPVEYDGTVTKWELPICGNLRGGGSYFTITYKAYVK